MPVTELAADEAWAREVAEALSPWFLAHQRDLSFRHTRDPWAIWVSEIMLQQTRVETVERHYSAFVQRFPDVGTLAAADEADVLAAWSGLGYYRRARMLHRGARHVAALHGGVVPREPEALRAIPGVGPYTAGAIGSIAFDEPVPLVDGNVARVLSRLHAIEAPAQQAASARGHWSVVESILRHGRPRVLAQALMELGATVCTPRSPRCGACPVRSSCRANTEGSVSRIPAPRPKKDLLVQRFAAVALHCRGKRLFVRRPTEGLLGDLWCLPLVPLAARRVRPEPAALGEVFDGELDLAAAKPGSVRHVFTHRIWDLFVVSASAPRRPRLRGVSRDRHAWVDPGTLPDGGIPTLTRKLVRALP